MTYQSTNPRSKCLPAHSPSSARLPLRYLTLLAIVGLATGCGGSDTPMYQVTATAGTGGSISPTSITSAEGSKVQLALTVNAGYDINTVSGCDGSLSGTTYTTGALSANCTVTASFKLKQYAVTATAAAGGSISPASSMVDHGTTTVLTVTPQTGYDINTVTGCGGTLAGDKYTTGAVTGACSVNATFKLKQYAVTAAAGTGGTITPTSSTVDHGSSVVLTVTPQTGYDINTVTGCGGSLAGDKYTTGAVTGACTVNASFKLKQYVVTATATAGGTVSPSSVTVDHGTTTVITVTADAGFDIAGVTGCGGTLVADKYTTAAITAACTVAASFSAKKTLTGTAAAGAPVIGKVIVLDSTGKTAEATIDANGKYSLNIAGLTPPLLLNARGAIGTKSISLTSVAYQADFGGTINITPFTDLIISNTIGQSARGWFDNADFSKLVPAQTTTARTELTNRLAPMLARLNVSNQVDLLRTEFSANHTGLDAALDIIRVDVNPQNNSATITNLLTQEALTDSFTATETDTLQDPGVLTTVIDDLTAIETRFKDFAALFATKVPADGDATYNSFFHASFLDDGSTNPNDLLPNFVGLEGFSFKQVGLVRKVSESQWVMNATVLDKTGTLLGAFTWHVIKDNGVWKFAGSQRTFSLRLHPMVWRDDAGYRSVIEFDYDTGKSNIAYIVLKGPGLNTNLMNAGPGVIFVVGSKSIVTNSALYNAKWLADCTVAPQSTCFTRDQLKPGANYTAQAYTANFATVGSAVTMTLEAVPMLHTTAQANEAKLFPKLTGIVDANGNAVTTKQQAAAGGRFVVKWSLPTRNVPACINTLGMEVVGQAQGSRNSSTNETLKCGATSGDVLLDAFPNAIQRAGAWLWIDHESGVSFGEGFNLN